MAAPTQLIFSAASCFPVLVHSCHSGDCDGRCGCTVDFAGELRLEQVISANSSPVAVPPTTVIRTTSCTTMPELLEENEKLRKENAQLNNELSQLKGLCNNILALMTNYASGQLDNVSLPEGKTVEILPARKADEGGAKVEEAEELDLTPRLFGVSIGAKRARREEEEEKNQLQQQQGENQPGSDVKSEPLDANNDHHQEPPWLELGKS